MQSINENEFEEIQGGVILAVLLIAATVVVTYAINENTQTRCGC